MEIPVHITSFKIKIILQIYGVQKVKYLNSKIYLQVVTYIR